MKTNKRVKKLLKRKRSLLLIMALSAAGALTVVKTFDSNTLRSQGEKSPTFKDLLSRNPASLQKETSTTESEAKDNMTHFPDLAQILTEYEALQMKLLKTNDEKQKLKNLYSEKAILDAKKFLMLPENSIDAQVSRDHLSTISFLNDAHSAQPTLSAEAFIAIILDQSVEDNKLSLSTRTLLAKDRAELMYHFTANEPKLHSSIQKALLGPVMQKIYGNVLKIQENNLRESRKAIANAKNNK